MDYEIRNPSLEVKWSRSNRATRLTSVPPGQASSFRSKGFHPSVSYLFFTSPWINKLGARLEMCQCLLVAAVSYLCSPQAGKIVMSTEDWGPPDIGDPSSGLSNGPALFG